METKYKDGNKISRTDDRAMPRRFRPLGKPPKPEISERVLASWTAFCRGEPSSWFRGFYTRAEREAHKAKYGNNPL